MDSWATEIGRGFGPEDSPEDLLRLLIGGHTRTLREATSAIDLAVMTEVSRRIAVSAQVDIYGVGGSAMLAEELQGRLYRIGIRAYAWSEVHTGLTSAAIQDAGHGGDRHLHHRAHRGDHPDARRGRPGRRADGGDHQQPRLAAGRGRRPHHRHLGVRAVPAARRPVGQARPAPGARPALPAGRPGELRPVQRQARRLGHGGRLASAPPPERRDAGPTTHDHRAHVHPGRRLRRRGAYAAGHDRRAGRRRRAGRGHRPADRGDRRPAR